MANPTYQQLQQQQNQIYLQYLQNGFMPQQAQDLANQWLQGAQGQYGYTASGQQLGQAIDPSSFVGAPSGSTLQDYLQNGSIIQQNGQLYAVNPAQSSGGVTDPLSSMSNDLASQAAQSYNQDPYASSGQGTGSFSTFNSGGSSTLSPYQQMMSSNPYLTGSTSLGGSGQSLASSAANYYSSSPYTGVQGTVQGAGGYPGTSGAAGYTSPYSQQYTVPQTTAVNQQIMQPAYEQQLGQQLGSYLSNNLSNYNPAQSYSGQYVAPMTSQQQTGLNTLTNYLGQGTGALTQQAQGVASQTLNGDFSNPATSPYIQALTAQSQTNLQNNINALNKQRGAYGSYFNTQTGAQQNQLVQQANQDLNVDVGQFENQAMQNQQAMVTTAANLDQMTQNQQLQQVQASQQYGGLQQQMQQAQLEAQYQDWLRTQQQQGSLISTTANLATNNPSYGFPTQYYTSGSGVSAAPVSY